MKRILIFFLLLSVFCAGYAQSDGNDNQQVQVVPDSLKESIEDFEYFVTDNMMVNHIDSIMEEGMYMQALEHIDSFQVNVRTKLGRELSGGLYLRKCRILELLEDWSNLAATVDEFMKFTDESRDKVLSYMYGLQGVAYSNIGEDRKAIQAFEHVVSHELKLGELQKVAKAYVIMGFCYGRLDKPSTASSFYKKGVEKYIEYFKTSYSYLLRNKLHVSDSDKEVLSLFASSLYIMAEHEEKNDNMGLAKDYFLMSANCGNPEARTRYRRLYED